MRIALVGYYGKGNFGDDVLLKVTHALVRQHFPRAEISILCDTYHEDYLPRLLGDACRVIQPGNREHFDLIVHGGGGTFFDYGRYGIGDRMIDGAIRLMGFRAFVALDRWARAALRRRRLSSDRRIGWGIGVGTFTPGSRRFRQALHQLLSFDSLAVRDATSLVNLERLGLAPHAVLGSDLAFLGEYWVPEALAHRPAPVANPARRPKLGLVLRGWPPYESEWGYLKAVKEALPVLSESYQLTVFVFDRNTDPRTIELAQDYPACLWLPLSVGFDAYCGSLAEQDLLVTSRAHGALCAAVLGVPALIIEIEPKLRTIHEMLPEATRMVKPATPVLSTWLPAINDLLSVKPNVIASEVARNRTLIEIAIDQSLS